MTRQHGLGRLAAFTAPILLSVLAAGLVPASGDPAAPRSPVPPPAADATERVLEPVAVVADETPAAELPPAPDAPPAPAPAPEPCADALAQVAAAGLVLPGGVDFLCPSTRFAHHGTACWDDWPCPSTAFVAINIELGAGATPEYLRHVVAHEICHIVDFRDRGWSTEPRADACAAAYGF